MFFKYLSQKEDVKAEDEDNEGVMKIERAFSALKLVFWTWISGLEIANVILYKYINQVY